MGEGRDFSAPSSAKPNVFNEDVGTPSELVDFPKEKNPPESVEIEGNGRGKLTSFLELEGFEGSALSSLGAEARVLAKDENENVGEDEEEPDSERADE